MMPMWAIPRALPPPNATPTFGRGACARASGGAKRSGTHRMTTAALRARVRGDLAVRRVTNRFMSVAFGQRPFKRTTHESSGGPRYVVETPIRRKRVSTEKLRRSASVSRRRAICRPRLFFRRELLEHLPNGILEHLAALRVRSIELNLTRGRPAPYALLLRRR